MEIIILTAVDESEDIYRAFNAGIDGYLMKDTSPEVILSTIEDVMKGASIFAWGMYVIQKSMSKDTYYAQFIGELQGVCSWFSRFYVVFLTLSNFWSHVWE